MTADPAAARRFLAAHGRVLDRHRLELVLGGGDPAAVMGALDGYSNPDGGFGWGLEPDLRAPESQPVGAMHALEAMSEVADRVDTGAALLCDWLVSRTLPDGGLPFALPVVDPTGCADLWLDPDITTSSLQMTAQVAANAHLAGRHDPAVRDHPWLARATDWCVGAIRASMSRPSAHELMFALRFVDTLGDQAMVEELLDRLGSHVPADGMVAVEGGSAGEVIRPLDLSPRPDGVTRRLFDPAIIETEVDRLADAQLDDGGWTVDFAAASPMAALEWRGYATVAALRRLIDHGRVTGPVRAV